VTLSLSLRGLPFSVTARVPLLSLRGAKATKQSLPFCHCERSEAVSYFHTRRKRKGLLRKRYYDLAVTKEKGRKNEARSDTLLLGQKTRLLRRRNHDLAVTFVGHCEGRRPEAIRRLRLLRKRICDLAVTNWEVTASPSFLSPRGTE